MGKNLPINKWRKLGLQATDPNISLTSWDIQIRNGLVGLLWDSFQMTMKKTQKTWGRILSK